VHPCLVNFSLARRKGSLRPCAEASLVIRMDAFAAPRLPDPYPALPAGLAGLGLAAEHKEKKKKKYI